MGLHRIERTRKIIGWSISGVVFVGVAWAVTPGFSWRSAPYADAATWAEGRELFTHEWTANDPLAGGDGLGPVFNAKSCIACHFQGGEGGAGPATNNVQTYLVAEKSGARLSGLVHRDAAYADQRESIDLLRRIHPVETTFKEVPAYHCDEPRRTRIVRIDKDPVLAIGSINTPALFGAGLVDRLPGKTIVQRNVLLQIAEIGRELNSDFSELTPGRPRFLKGGRVGKFGWKAQFATLEEFVAAACANELGLGTPTTTQGKSFAVPAHLAAASPPVAPDLSRKQFSALVAFCDTLPQPVETWPTDSIGAANAARGKQLFESIGCAVCHPADIGKLKGVYSDFLLHAIEPPQSGRGASGYGDLPSEDPNHSDPEAHEWKTPPLWGVADSAPYFHDGGSPTLETAILRHAGTAKPVAAAYDRLSREDQQALVAFLKTLRAPGAAPPAANTFGGLLAVH